MPASGSGRLAADGLQPPPDEGVQAALSAAGVEAVVELGMRYGNPSIPDAISRLRAQGCERILTVPLYPQYAASTTATVVDAVTRHAARLRDQPEMRFIKRFHQEPSTWIRWPPASRRIGASTASRRNWS